MKRKIYAMVMLWPILTLFMCSVTQAQAEQSDVPAYGNSASGVAEPAALGTLDVDTIVPLQIGDTIPEALWHLPLQVINHPESKNTITLNDYRGRLILLDFWALWCSSCIAALPKLDQTQSEFRDHIAIIPILREGRERSIRLWQRNQITQHLRLPSAVGDTLLYRLFDHQTVSHIVWVTPNGTICSTTGTDRVAAENLWHVLAGKSPNWPPKIDREAFSDRTVLHYADTPYYTGFGRYLAGAQSLGHRSRDSITHAYRRSLTNAPLYLYILMANTLNPTTFPNSQISWKVQDRSRYIKPLSVYKSDWQRQNTYCYEVCLPYPVADSIWQHALMQDFYRYFPGLSSRLDTTDVPCLLLVKKGNLSKFRSKETTRYIQLAESDSVKYLYHISTDALTHVLNQYFHGLPVVDETAYSHPISISLRVPDLTDVSRVRLELNRQGLDLVPATRKIPMLTVTDTHRTFLNPINTL